MACFRPVKGFRSRKPNCNGKYYLTFSPRDGYLDRPLQVKCGYCIGCRQDRVRSWAVRCMHEASLHEFNSFLTLTYSRENLPPGGTLVRKHFQDFMKRLRQYAYRHFKVKIRSFYCGEYGSKLSRPHYHALIFGFDFPDRREFKKGLFTSDVLTKLWGLGHCSIGSVNYASARYVASYVVKKVYGNSADFYGGRLPEFCSMSRRPGVGKRWVEKFGKQCLREGTVVAEGREQRAPVFYERVLEREFPREVHSVKTRRMQRSYKNRDDNSPERLRVKEKCMDAKLNLYSRSYENAKGIRDLRRKSG